MEKSFLELLKAEPHLGFLLLLLSGVGVFLIHFYMKTSRREDDRLDQERKYLLKLRDEIDSLNRSHRNEIMEINHSHRLEISELNRMHREEINQLKSELEKATLHILNLMGELTETKRRLVESESS
jgi:hypothetical protein